MTRAKNITVVEEVPSPPIQEPDADVGRILAEIGDSGKYVSIKRMNAITKAWEYVTKYDLSEFEDFSFFLDRVKEDHGGGRYQARIYGDKGQGKIEYLRFATFDIDGRFRPAVVPPPTPPSAAVLPSSDLSEIKQALALLAQAISNMVNTPRHDPLDVGLRIAEAMTKNVQPALVSPPQSNMAEMFSIFKQGLELGQTASGGEGLGYLPVIEKLGGPLVNLLEKVAARPNPVIEKTKQNGGATLSAPKPQTPEQYLQAYLPQILGLAAEQKNPALYAELVLDRTPESQYDFLYGVATRPDVIPYLTTLHPGVKEHESWFLEFAKAIKEELEPEAEEKPITPELEIHDDPQAAIEE